MLASPSADDARRECCSLSDLRMELTFYDSGGRPVAYCDDGLHVYAFRGDPLAYLDIDAVFAFDGYHLGWWSAGCVRDHDGGLALFTEAARINELPLPAKQTLPVKRPKTRLPAPAYKGVRSDPVHTRRGWSIRSGAHFFFRMR